MPGRRNKKQVAAGEEEDPNIVKGGPLGSKIDPEKGGRQPNPDDEDEEVDNEEGKEEGESGGKPDDDESKPITRKELREAFAGIRDELSSALAGPRNRKVNKAVEEEEDTTNWDELLYKNPKEAVKKIRDDAVERAKRELRAEYSQDRGFEIFWNNFYADNPDLDRKQDHDLVNAILQANSHEWADLPAEKAAAKLADLTRDRIMRYAGNHEGNKGGKRVVVEGAGAPRDKKAPKDDDKVVTLGDIIRRRKEKRRAAAAGRGVAA